MKKPRISFSKDALLGLLLGHGEKFVVALFGLFACTLAWGGVEAFRNLRPKGSERPEAIVEDSKKTDEHIDSVKIAPDSELTSEKGLSALVEPWLSTKIAPTARPLVLDKPLFAELAKRSSPDILPVEDLRAVAGVIAIAAKPAPAGGRQAAADKPTELDVAAAPKGGKPGRTGARGGPQPGAAQPAMQPPPVVPGQPGDMSGMTPPPDQGMGQPKLVPYVIVTGLIPVKKQFEEYDRRFVAASLHDVNIDTPRWNSYRIEKAEIIPGVAEKWVPVDVKTLARQYSAEWLRLQAEPMIGPMQLPPELEPRDRAVSPIPFCSPLPQLADGAWGFKALHPWFVDHLIRENEARKAKEKAALEAAPEDVFGGAGQMPGGGPMMNDPSMVGSMPTNVDMAMGAGLPRQAIDAVEYRLFRFVDLAVMPGRSYRYRVKVVCWNPNLNLPTRHLLDTSLAKKQTLESPASDPTPPTLVPDGRQLLVQPAKKDFLKKLKPGLAPIMVLGEKPKGGAFSLRGLIMEPGGLANVDPKSNKKGDPRAFGDELTTDRVLLDSRGDRQDRAETVMSGKPTPPPEPLEMIFLRSDGTFEFASSAESQPQIDRYRQTAPPELGGPSPASAQPAPGAASPFGNPFSPPAGPPR